MGRGFSRSNRSRLRSNDGSIAAQLHADVTQCVLDVGRVEMHDQLLAELVVLDAHHQSARPFQVPELTRVLEGIGRRLGRGRTQVLVELELAHPAGDGRLFEEVVAWKRRKAANLLSHLLNCRGLTTREALS